MLFTIFVLTFCALRHVHITEATLYKLNNEYHVEPYLSEPFQTYLIVSSEVTSYKSHLFHLLLVPQDHQDIKLPDEKTFQTIDSIKTIISNVDDELQPLNIQDITLKVEDLNYGNNLSSTTQEMENDPRDQRKNSSAVLSVNSDQDIGLETRKNSNTSIRTIQSMPKYTECLAADKPFANISNKRMTDNITRAVSYII